MPIFNGNPHCINHPDVPMRRNVGLSAITELVRSENEKITFNPSSGIPVVVYYCDVCGYIEMYAAQKTSYWESEKKKT